MSNRYQLTDGRIILASLEFISAHYPTATLLPDLPVQKEPLSIVDFRSRFTDGEKIAIYTAAESSPAIRVWLDEHQSAQYVSLDDPRTVAGIHAMEYGGLISAGRAEQILA